MSDNTNELIERGNQIISDLHDTLQEFCELVYEAKNTFADNDKLEVIKSEIS